MTANDSRVLAVILHADVIGSTELVLRNETLAHEKIQEIFNRFSRVIGDYGGVTRELRGDALLAEFSRGSDAVCAAVQFQQSNIDDVNNEMPVHLRVGIAMGEVVTADGTITGPGVVMAQRLEQLAASDGTCIQGAVYETLPDRFPFDYDSLGEQTLKGFAEPVRAYNVLLQSGKEVPQPAPARSGRADDGSGAPKRRTGFYRWVPVAVLAGLVLGVAAWFGLTNVAEEPQEIAAEPVVSTEPSIAVLPFDNLGGDPEQDYFSDGLADDIIIELSNIPGLFVTARNSSFAYRDDERSVQEIAASLGVRYLLDGSVRRDENQVRINAQLIDAETGQYVWSARLDQRLENIFQLQDQVTHRIMSALELNLDAKPERKPETNTFEAYDVLLKALEVQARFTPEDSAEGRLLFQQAADIDPNYARAHAGVGLTHANDVNMNWTTNQRESIELGLKAANRALELDPELSRAYFAKGALLLAARQHNEAEAVMERVVEMDPNYAEGRAQQAFILMNSGKHEEALVAIARAKQLNPLYSALYMYVEAMALFHLERYEEAAGLLEVAVERNPAFDRMQLMYAASLAYLGETEKAQWSVEEAKNLSPQLSIADEQMDSVLLVQSDLDRYLDGLRLAGLE